MLHFPLDKKGIMAKMDLEGDVHGLFEPYILAFACRLRKTTIHLSRDSW
jgi:hypothetical protein